MTSHKQQLEWLDKISILGLTLQVTTKFEDKFHGQVFFYNPETNILILSTSRGLLTHVSRGEDPELEEVQLHLPEREVPHRAEDHQHQEHQRMDHCLFSRRST